MLPVWLKMLNFAAKSNILNKYGNTKIICDVVDAFGYISKCDGRRSLILSDRYHDNEDHRYVVVEHDDDDETVTVTSGITTTAQVVITSGTGQVVYNEQTVISSSPVVILLPETKEEQTYRIEIETGDSSLYGEFCQTVK